MKFTILSFSIFFFLPGFAEADPSYYRKLSCAISPEDCGTTVDPQSGNVYEWQKHSGVFGDETHTDGSNARTGSQWNWTTRPDGSMNGVDAAGSAWNYRPNPIFVPINPTDRVDLNAPVKLPPDLQQRLLQYQSHQKGN